jgi:hypothetical protein
MLISFELLQTIDSPIDKVFAFLSDFCNMLKWNYYITSVSQTTPGQIQHGTVFKQTRPRDILSYQIKAFHPPHSVMVEVLPPDPLLQLAFTLSPINQSTQVVYSWQLDLQKYKLLAYIPNGWIKNAILAIVKKIVLQKVKPAVADNFAKLKILLETGEVVLQDVRRILLT